jgi:hypothetical protein
MCNKIFYWGWHHQLFFIPFLDLKRIEKEISSNINEMSSAFFFVFHDSSTSLKIVNEKDSASMSCK